MKYRVLFPLLLNALVACGDDSYSVGGTVTGLAGSVVLTNGNDDHVTLSSPGAFAFSETLERGAHYWVAVFTQPATQTCTVSNNTGAVDAKDVTDISVICAADSYGVGGTVSGLAGTLVLTNNTGDTLTVTADGRFRFSSALAAGAVYNVAIQSQPDGQTCAVQNGQGTAATDVTSVTVTCSAKTFTIGGSIAGLTGSVVLQNNAGDTLTVSANGELEFLTPVPYAGTYDVSVLTQPTTQTCAIADGQGQATADVTNVRIVCTDNLQVGGTVSGLVGTLQIANNGGPPRTITNNGQFIFSVAKGTTYEVKVAAQPLTQTCAVTNGGPGTVKSNVMNIVITCSTNAYTVGGVITGLNGSVVLQQNGQNNLTLDSNRSFTFSSLVASGAPYDVTVLVQPQGATCSIENGSGVVGRGDITDVQVNCGPI